MAFTSNLDPREARLWEMDPSTRESLRLYTKRKPIDVTLTTPDTAQDLITVGASTATVNLVTNPSCETADPPTGYTALRSATLAQDATYYNFGTKSLKITPPGTLIGEGAYWNLGSFPGSAPLSISAYFRRGVAGNEDVRVELAVASMTSKKAGTISNARLAVGNIVALSGSWQRSTLVSNENRTAVVFHISGASAAFNEDETITGGTSGATAVVRTTNTANTYLVCDSLSATQFTSDKNTSATETITGSASGSTATLSVVERIPLTVATLHLYLVTAEVSTTVFYVDGVQAEAQEQVTTYCDGAQGWLNFWDGTAHASTSRRWRAMSNIRGMRLHVTRDCYVNYDADASNTATDAEDKGEMIKAGTDLGTNSSWWMDKKISFINANAGEQPRIYGVIEGV